MTRSIAQGSAGDNPQEKMMNLQNAVIVITGASSGIGAATARAAAQAGAQVVLLARRKARIDALAATLPAALAIACDVTQTDHIQQAVQQTLRHFGRIDVLINNAGQGLYAGIDAIAAADFRALLELNLIAPLMMMQAVIPPMRQQGGGSIINISSGATLGIYPGSAAYTSTKAALNIPSGVARLELAAAGSCASTCYPFMTATEFYQAVQSGQHQATQQETESAAVMHSPEQAAAVILQLIISGAAQSDGVPEAWGGSYREAPDATGKAGK